MTCIVGYAHTDANGQKRVVIGGDSAGISGWEVTQRKDPKVFVVDDFLFGFTSSFRMGQILQHSFKPPIRNAGEDLFAYMCTKFVDEIRRIFAEKGFAGNKDDKEKGGTFLVGTQGRLFRIDSDFQVAENICGFDAVGCGASIALGAMSVYVENSGEPEKSVLGALAASEKFSIGVCGPFNVLAV